MQRLDLDDLPPRVARELADLAEGEELVLVQNGVVVRRLTAGAAAGPAQPEPPADEARAAEILEEFRSMMEDEF